MNTSSSALWMHGAARRFVSCLSAISCATRSPSNRCTLPVGGKLSGAQDTSLGGQGTFSLAIVSNTLPGDLFRSRNGRLCKSVRVFNLLQDGIGNADTPAAVQKWLRCQGLDHLYARYTIINSKYSPAKNRRISNTVSPTATASAKHQSPALTATRGLIATRSSPTLIDDFPREMLQQEKKELPTQNCREGLLRKVPSAARAKDP